MMALLDTNVAPEPIRKAPDPAVEAWTAGRPAAPEGWQAFGETGAHPSASGRKPAVL